MKLFIWRKGKSKELKYFSHILEFALQNHNAVNFHSLGTASAAKVRIVYIIEGNFFWKINQQPQVLYPGDCIVLAKGEQLEDQVETLHMGKICWLQLNIKSLKATKLLKPGLWSALSSVETESISSKLNKSNKPVLTGCKEMGSIFGALQSELQNKYFGYITRVNQLIDQLFILIARHLFFQTEIHRYQPPTFVSLEQTLRKNLAHKWTVEKMASLVGMRMTSFTEKIKKNTGYSPLNYLITIRISEAIKMLRKGNIRVTDIALDTGFYSSQHFSTTFKKLTGSSPREFRRKIE